MTKKKIQPSIPTREVGGVIYNELNNFFNLNALCKKKNLNTQHVMNTKEFVDMLIKTCNALHREDGKYRVYGDVIKNTRGRSSITWVHPMMLNSVLQKKDGTFYGRPSRSKKKTEESDSEDDTTTQEDAEFLENFLEVDPSQPVPMSKRDKKWLKKQQEEDSQLNKLMDQHPVKGALPRNNGETQYLTSLAELDNHKKSILQRMKQNAPATNNRPQAVNQIAASHLPFSSRSYQF